jgi:hypothetical protein
MASTEGLLFSSERLLVVLRCVIEDKKLKKIMKDLNNLTPAGIRAKYEETHIRNFVEFHMLMTGGGKSVSKMKIGELKGASEGDDGLWVVNVIDQKTTKFGPSSVTFIMPKLYRAALKFVRAFRGNSDDEELVFVNSTGRELDLKICSSWMKTNYLAEVLTKEEFHHFTPKIWQQAWTKWASQASHSNIKELAAKVMGPI